MFMVAEMSKDGTINDHANEWQTLAAATKQAKLLVKCGPFDNATVFELVPKIQINRQLVIQEISNGTQ